VKPLVCAEGDHERTLRNHERIGSKQLLWFKCVGAERRELDVLSIRAVIAVISSIGRRPVYKKLASTSTSNSNSTGKMRLPVRLGDYIME
jgi:hypothetical protein